MNLNEIKKEILAKLIQFPAGVRYRDAKKYAWENDLYNYHLQTLVKDGLIKKNKGNYSLTDKGRKFVEVEYPLDPLAQTSDLFRLNVLLIVYRKKDSKFEILNQTRKRTPYSGDTGIIGGGIKKGELISDACNRKIKIETGLSANFRHISSIRKMRYTNDDELFSDIEFHVCCAKDPVGDLINENEYGKNFWVDIDTAILNESSSVMGSKYIVEILSSLKNSNFSDIPFRYCEEKKIISKFK